MEIKCLIKHKVAVADFHDLPQSVYSSRRSRPFCDSNQISHKFWHVVEVITFRRVLLPLCHDHAICSFLQKSGHKSMKLNLLLLHLYYTSFSDTKLLQPWAKFGGVSLFDKEGVGYTINIVQSNGQRISSR